MNQPQQQPASRAKKSTAGRVKTILFLLLPAFIIIQFFQGDKNNNNVAFNNDITLVVAVPGSVHTLLQNACYDCHSNSTKYPWYTNIQPLGWWLSNHIKNGKRHLNFSEFGSFSPEKQIEKLDEIADSQRKGWMPLSSYTWVHAEAKLTGYQKQQLIQWAEAAKAKIVSGR